MNTLISLPAYSRQGFINRDPEVAEVRAKLNQILEGQTVDKRTFIFTGQHGIGKSWFLLRLRQELETQSSVMVWHLDLANYMAVASPAATIVEICRTLWQQLPIPLAMPSDGLEDATRTLIHAIKQQILRQQVLVLLLDTVYEAPATLLETLENYLLAPLAIERNVLLVMAGRGREYAWTAPELRLRAEFRTLQAFNKAYVAEQLQFYMPARTDEIDEIYQISLGNPKTTLLVAASAEPVHALNQIINEMLPLVAFEERRLMHQHLEALAVPRRFDYSHVPRLLSAYYDDPTYLQLTRRQIRVVFDRLLDPGLIYWDNTQLAYTLHSAMRNLLLRHLISAQYPVWHRLHSACVELYQRWVQDKPRNWEQWQAELEYHQQALERSNQ